MSTTTKKKPTKPFALPDTLRDLALLRASDVDLAALLPASESPITSPAAPSPVQASLAASYEFARAARTALKIHNRGDVDVPGARVEEVRGKLEELVDGLQPGGS